MKVSSRLALGFGLVLGLLILVSALGYYGMAKVNASLDDTAINVQETKLANTLTASVRDRAIALRNLALLNDSDAMKPEVERIAQQEKKYADAYAALGQLFARDDTTPKEKSLYAEIKQAETATMPFFEQAARLGQANDQVDAKSTLMDEVKPRQAVWLEKLAELAALEQQQNDDAAQAAHAAYVTIRTITLAMTVVALVIGVAAALLITRGILKQLGGEPAEAQEVAREIANGNLTVQLRVARGDRTSLMASLESMRQRLSEIVAGIKASAESISVAAAEIAQGNVELSQRTEEQAASLEQTAASMEQLTSTVKQNTSSATEGSTLAVTASQTAAQCGDVVQNVVTTMQDITASSTRVSEIISVIEGIAFQTNILALNAAVESARAGEQGRGFAVVAGEVRALAQRSSSAAKEIKELIDASVGHVANGSRLVRDAGGTMDEVVRSIERVSTIMAEVASASNEQSTGIEQVNVAVGQMDGVTQQNAALVEEAAAAAHAMSNQAQMLREAVAIFRV